MAIQNIEGTTIVNVKYFITLDFEIFKHCPICIYGLNMIRSKACPGLFYQGQIPLLRGGRGNKVFIGAESRPKCCPP
jgi:hypothetical protein